MIRDMGLACSNRELANAWIAHGVPAWLYTFSFPLEPLERIAMKLHKLTDKVFHTHFPWKYLGDIHGIDVMFLWGPNWFMDIANIGSTALSNIMSCLWTTFAHTGDPNGLVGEPLPPNCADVHTTVARWPQYENSSRQFYSLTVPPEVHAIRAQNAWPDDEFPSDERCNLWSEMAFPWHEQLPSPRVAEGNYES